MVHESPNHNWRPTAELSVLRRRAALLSAIRQYFAESGALEVETPLLSRAASSELHLDSMRVQGPGMHEAYLHTSPELAMKRLLAAGSGDIYQICKVFRAGEQGSRHNPEFTLLEWYRTGFDMQAMMQETSDLLTRLLAERLEGEPLYLSYRQAFLKHADVDPFHAGTTQLQAAYQARMQREVRGVEVTRDWLDLILSDIVQPALPSRRLVFIHGFPAAQASLARYCPDDPSRACRFEVFAGGLELANGFEELTAAAEQTMRIEAEQALRKQAGRDQLPVDARFLAAMHAGLPPCSGVAVGLDRVLMLVCGLTHIAQALSFDFASA